MAKLEDMFASMSDYKEPDFGTYKPIDPMAEMVNIIKQREASSQLKSKQVEAQNKAAFDTEIIRRTQNWSNYEKESLFNIEKNAGVKLEGEAKVNYLDGLYKEHQNTLKSDKRYTPLREYFVANSIKPSDMAGIEAERLASEAKLLKANSKKASEGTNPIRGAADMALSLGQGVLGGFKSLTDLAGASNVVSDALDSGSKFLEKGKDDYTLSRTKFHAEAIKKAEESGDLQAEASAYLAKLYDQSGDTIAQGVGSFVPNLLLGLATGGAGTAASLGITAAKYGKLAPYLLKAAQAAPRAALGLAQGVGSIKGSQYEQTFNNAKAKGLSDDEAKALADNASEYSAANAGQQALGGALGLVAGATGPIEGAIAKVFTKKAVEAGAEKVAADVAKKGLLNRTATGFATEAITEGAQGGQERYAGNLGGISQGVLDPSKSMRGVVGQGLSEGIVGGVIGGGVSAANIGNGSAKPATDPTLDPVNTETPPQSPLTVKQRADIRAMPQEEAFASYAAATGADLTNPEVNAATLQEFEALRAEPTIQDGAVAKTITADAVSGYTEKTSPMVALRNLLSTTDKPTLFDALTVGEDKDAATISAKVDDALGFIEAAASGKGNFNNYTQAEFADVLVENISYLEQVNAAIIADDATKAVTIGKTRTEAAQEVVKANENQLKAAQQAEAQKTVADAKAAKEAEVLVKKQEQIDALAAKKDMTNKGIAARKQAAQDAKDLAAKTAAEVKAASKTKKEQDAAELAGTRFIRGESQADANERLSSYAEESGKSLGDVAKLHADSYIKATGQGGKNKTRDDFAKDTAAVIRGEKPAKPTYEEAREAGLNDQDAGAIAGIRLGKESEAQYNVRAKDALKKYEDAIAKKGSTGKPTPKQLTEKQQTPVAKPQEMTTAQLKQRLQQLEQNSKNEANNDNTKPNVDAAKPVDTTLPAEKVNEPTTNNPNPSDTPSSSSPVRDGNSVLNISTQSNAGSKADVQPSAAAVQPTKEAGVAPIPATPPEIRAEQEAAAAKARKKRMQAAANALKPFREKSPFLGWLLENSVNSKEKNEWKDFNPSTIATGPLFRKKGYPLDILHTRAIEDGYLSQESSESDLRALISRQASGDSIAPLYTEDGATNVMQAEIDRRTQFEEDAAFEELSQVTYTTAELDALEDIPWDTPVGSSSKKTTRQAMEAMGFSEQEIKDEIAREQRITQEASQSSSSASQAEASQPREGTTTPTRDAEALTLEPTTPERDRANAARAANAPALDAQQQAIAENQAQPLVQQTAPDQRTDNTGDMFALEKAQVEIDKANEGKAVEVDPNQGTMFSQSPTTTNPSNPTAIRTAIEGIFSGMKGVWERIGKSTKIIGSDEITAAMIPMADKSRDTAQAFFDGKTGDIYLIHDRIPLGEERGVWLHEVGHKRLKEAVGAENMQKLHDAVQGWKTRKGTVEQDIYNAANKRATDAATDKNGKVDKKIYNDEFLAYAIEEASKRRITPDAGKGTITAAGWLAKVAKLFSAALRKLTGVASDIKLNANDLMAMAYGAAGLEYQYANVFRDGHVAPSAETDSVDVRQDTGGDFSLAEIAQGFHNQPDDYFDTRVGARYYGYENTAGRESKTAVNNLIRQQKAGKELSNITIYRAVPKDSLTTRMKNGDWVSLSKTYAMQNGSNRFGKYLIIEQTVSPNDVWWDGNDINEFGYDDSLTAGAQGNGIHFSKLSDTANAKLRSAKTLAGRAAATVVDIKTPEGKELFKQGFGANFRGASNLARRALIGLFGLREIANYYESSFKKDDKNLLNVITDINTKKGGEVVNALGRLDQVILKDFAALDAITREALGKVMQLSTAVQYNGADIKTAITPEEKQIKAGYNALPQAAKNVYKKVLAEHGSQWDRYSAEVVKSLTDLGTDVVSVAKIKKELADNKMQVYFATQRFGNYVVSATENGVDVFFRRYESTAQAEKESKQLQKENPTWKVTEPTAYENRVKPKFNSATESFIVSVQARLKEKGKSEDEIKLVAETLYGALESRLVKKTEEMMAKRKGIQGADTDMLRSTISSMKKMEQLISATRNNQKLAKAIGDAKKHVDDQKYNDDYDSIEAGQVIKAYEDSVYYKAEESPAQTAVSYINSAGFISTMGFNVSSGLVNMSGILTMLTPQLTAGHGAKAFPAIMKAMYEVGKKLTTDPKKLTGDIKIVTDYAISIGKLQYGEARELLDVASGLGTKASAAMEFAGRPMAWAEKMVNLTSLLASYRLNIGKGLSSETALENAKNDMNRSNFDSASINKGVIAKTPPGRVLMFLKSYGFSMAMSMMADVKKILDSKQTKEERRFAAKHLMGIVGAHAIISGMTGLPFIAAFPIFLLAATLGDADDEREYTVQLKEAIYEAFGKENANYLYHGLIGEGLSGRISLDNLIIRARMDGADNKKLSEDWTNQLMGAGIGNINKAWRESVQFKRELETLPTELAVKRFAQNLPIPAVANIAKGAVLFEDDGIKYGKDGRPINEIPASNTEMLLQMVGVRSETIANAQTERSTAQTVIAKQNEQRKRLLEMYNALGLEVVKGNVGQEQLELLKDQIQLYNEKNPNKEITEKVLSNRLKKLEENVDDEPLSFIKEKDVDMVIKETPWIFAK